MGELKSFNSAVAVCSLAERVERKGSAWTVDGLAELMECSDKLIYKQIKSGKLPAIRLGSMLRIDPKDAGQWIRSRTTAAPVKMRRAA
jgi:excisionase family DNA binding protein